MSVSAPATARGGEFTFNRSRRDSHLQAAAVVDGGLQGYPGNKDPVVPVDAVALAYVEAEGLSRSFDYLDEVNGVLRILKQRSRVRGAQTFLIRAVEIFHSIRSAAPGGNCSARKITSSS